MKPIARSLTVLGALLLAACTSVTNISRSEFDNRTYEVEAAMTTVGYHPVAFNAELVNEGHNDGDKWVDNYVWYDRRSFADSLGNMAEYTMRYLKYNNRITQLAVTGCAVSNSRHYANICGSRGIVRRITSKH